VSVRSKQANGKLANGKQANGKQANVKQANGKLANGKQANGKQANGKQANGKQANGKPSHISLVIHTNLFLMFHCDFYDASTAKSPNEQPEAASHRDKEHIPFQIPTPWRSREEGGVGGGEEMFQTDPTENKSKLRLLCSSSSSSILLFPYHLILYSASHLNQNFFPVSY